MNKIRLALLCVLLFGITLMSVGPVAATGPFVEYQDVPVWDSTHGRMCILRTTWTTYPDGSAETFEQLIC